jgi:pimeloyl-ACP methyl ester carboxylesterase
MKHRTSLCIACASALCGILFFCATAFAASQCEPDGLQASGSIYRICMPDSQDYNGRLIVWAHGFQRANEPVSIPEDQLQARGRSVQGFVNDLGFGFATNSYSKTGLAVKQGVDDILDLVTIYSALHGAPEKTYLIGVSEGGLITALLVERHPEVFAGGLAACGPVGDFPYQVNYIGDARATFAYFFPGLIPGDPFQPPADLIAGWESVYQTQVGPAIIAPEHRRSLNQWVRVAKLSYDPAQPLLTKELSARRVLRYAVVNLNDATATLGGFPIDNRLRQYSGSADDAALNRLVPRIDADPAALAEMQAHYNTSGRLETPLITLHSILDPLVPYRHETLYIGKTKASGSFRHRHFNIKTSGYGHCQFTEGEVLFAVAMLGLYTGDTSLLEHTAARNLEPALRKEFRKLASLNKIRIRFSEEQLGIRLPGGIRF